VDFGCGGEELWSGEDSKERKDEETVWIQDVAHCGEDAVWLSYRTTEALGVWVRWHFWGVE